MKQNLIHVWLTVIVLSLFPGRGTAQNAVGAIPAPADVPVSAPAREAAFGDGEKITFSVSYKAGIVNTDVAEVYMNTKLQRVGSRDIFRIDAGGRTLSFFNWFFQLDDTYVSRLDVRTLLPIDLRIEIREGDYRVSEGYFYDWNTMQATTFARKFNDQLDSTWRSLALRSGAMDAVALFYNLRSEDTDSFIPGESRILRMVLRDTIRNVRFRFDGRENKNVKGLGKFKTLRFVCQIATNDAESFEDGSEFTLWISDDKNKIPLYIESPIRVGSIRGRLISAERLKHPLDSRIQ